ncbi:MAG TPA: ABC-F family ATP-binding cassette domain-containing protein [Gammaproteobacteria bacterium]|nr:ABC-F family ATP-binding cassette domain-containing protein [Gammaproteobacteria bacterium]
MMAPRQFVSCQSIGKSWGLNTLFSGITLSVGAGERLGLIGPNGSGKSTFLKLLAGSESPDNGQVVRTGGVNLVHLSQEDTFPADASVSEVLQAALPARVREQGLNAIRNLIRDSGFTDTAQPIAGLSGGWRKRLAIACALAREPDLLLLDEPTNHLDLEGILWLETVLKKAGFAFVLVTHDRYLLENVGNRIVELDPRYPDGYLSVQGSYSTFLQRRAAALDQQAQQEQVLSNKLRREVEWLRRGPKARTTKARSRIDSAMQLQDDVQLVKVRNANNAPAQIEFDASGRKTRKLIEVSDATFRRGGRLLFEHLDMTLTPGTCIGILGRNGSGKSSLMQMLKGELPPDAGTVLRADELKIVHFDQRREQLDQQQTLRQALAPAGDTVLFRGQALHVVSWARRFLFPAEKLGLPVARLSGGEQARVLLARLMLQAADVLLLDEPTNDLDIPTLDVLEESLADFPGAIVLITHDRFLMNRLSDGLLYLDGTGAVSNYADYEQWSCAGKQDIRELPAVTAKPVARAARGLSYEEQKELNRIGNKIEKAEQEVNRIEAQLHDPAIMSDAARLQQLHTELESAKRNVEKIYQRWETLERIGQAV